MDKKRLFGQVNQSQPHKIELEDQYPDDRRYKSNQRGMPLRTSLRASKRSLRGMGYGEQTDLRQITPGRVNIQKPLINTKSLRYNPSGPGDYNIPSSFGELPPVKGLPPSVFTKQHESNVLKKNPSFSMGARIHNNQVISSHMSKFIGVDTPGVGSYDPLSQGFEDKKKLKVLKRLNMYASGTRQNRSLTLQQPPEVQTASATDNIEKVTDDLNALSVHQSQTGVQPIIMGDIPRMRHISPNAASSRNQPLYDEAMFTEPNGDKSFGTQKRFFQPMNANEFATVPIQYDNKYTSLVKSTFSKNGVSNQASQSSLRSGIQSVSPTRHQKAQEFHQILGKVGRPLFNKDKDKHETPAPAYYRPDVYEAYQSRTKFNLQRQSIPQQKRFVEISHFRFANDKTVPGAPPRANKQVCYPEQEKLEDPGPGQYQDTETKYKSKVLHTIPSTDRNLLINPHKEKVDTGPGPANYNLDAHLSMCASTNQFNNPSLNSAQKSREHGKMVTISPQSSIQEFLEKDKATVNQRAKQAYASDARYRNREKQHYMRKSNQSNRSKSSSSIKKFEAAVKPKMTNAPKMKMGVIGTAKRHTEMTIDWV